MDWVWLIFLIVGVGVWIVVTVFRKAEEERLRNEQRRRDAIRGGGRRPTTDLDRFLDEARRRREAGDRVARPAEAPWAVPVERPRRPREVRPAAPRRAPRPQPFAPAVRRPASEPRPIPTAIPVAPSPGPAPVVLEVVPDDTPGAAPALAVPTPAQPVITLARPTAPVSPVLTQMRGWLRQPQSLATAFILGEILGPPGGRRAR